MRILLLMAVLLIIPVTVGADLHWVAFTATRHVNTTSFTEVGFDAALREVNDCMRYDNHDCPDDVPCTVRFYRNGNIGRFGIASDGLDVITTELELNEVFSITTHRIKVVDAIDYCAGGINPSIIGCGRCNGFGFIVEHWVSGVVFAHEYGHNVGVGGCGHRDDCNYNIMHTYWNGANNSVNSSECSQFGGKAYTLLCGNVYDGAGGPLTVSGGPYWVTCDVTVPAGRTLTIQAGVAIQFHPGLRIKSDGYTIGDGSTGRITIYSNNDNKNYPTAIVDSELVIKSGGVLLLE
jgi:hypothetical protein